jgi:hypothetical protein
MTKSFYQSIASHIRPLCGLKPLATKKASTRTYYRTADGKVHAHKPVGSFSTVRASSLAEAKKAN